MADAGDRAEQVGARAQVREFAQVFQRMRLGLHRVGERILDPTTDLELRDLNLEALALTLRLDQRARRDDRAAGGQVFHLGVVVG